MFNINNEVSAVSTGSSRLEGNKIHTVKLTGIELAKVGKSSEYDVLNIHFEGVGESKGTFTDTWFCPKPDRLQRVPNSFGGVNASDADEIIVKLRQYIFTFNSKVHNDIESGTISSLNMSWDDIRKFMVKALTPAIGKEAQLKLLKNANGNAIIPGFIAAIGKDSKPYPRTNFIGEKLEFNTKEAARILEAANSKPTNMSDFSSIAGTGKGSEDSGDKSFDFNLL